MARMRPADCMWVGLAAYVVGCNVCACARGTEMLSEAADRYLAGNRWVTELVMLSVYAHVSNRVPDRYDPIHWGFLGVKRLVTHVKPRSTR
ncbi:hypothetical protein SEA_TYPHA_30 [Mycobacterium phage Typha]|uniref:Uncharacterized protein n=1 Tax=Mycobacterium phage Typha TaxID=2517971 RepID=A0A482J6P8_9CAUD|nr:hypothetical protein KCH40_gp030 [Mycobacterium phage Typha]QBP29687.1 hypothetical protein SEA_TYPHA_30 [Mycobacterium phage Typha]URM86474.1 hypothetical protein PBI_HILLTOPFARM_30 [Mycobacterium phage Hilltopfarm]